MLFSLKDDKVIKISPKFVANDDEVTIDLNITFGTGGLFVYKIKNEKQLSHLIDWIVIHLHEFTYFTKEEFKKTLTYDLDNIK